MKPKSDQLEPNSHPSRWVLLTLGWELWVPSLAITKVWVLIFRESAGWRFHLISACYSAFIRALRKINWQSHVNNGTQKANPSASNSCRSQQSWSALSVKTIASSRNSPPLCYFFFPRRAGFPRHRESLKYTFLQLILVCLFFFVEHLLNKNCW